MNGRGILHSGIHLTRQYEEARASQQEIADNWLRCQRGIEDALVKSGDTEIQDADLKSSFEDAERRKDEAITKVLLMTDEYLGSRSSHDLAMIESAKKQVFGDLAR